MDGLVPLFGLKVEVSIERGRWRIVHSEDRVAGAQGGFSKSGSIWLWGGGIVTCDNILLSFDRVR